MRFVLASIGLLAVSTAGARPWTNTEGKVIEADFVSSDGEQVVLRMDGREIHYPLEKLSQEDREFVASRQDTSPRESTVETGKITNVPLDSRLFPEVKDYFKERDRKSALEAFESGKHFKQKGSAEEWLRRDEGKDRCRFYVPASYDGSEPYGLFLWINSGFGDIPSKWHGVFDQLKLIAVSADDIGNTRPMLRRVGFSMDALATAEKRFNIDPLRRIVSGRSGGGHMAMLTAALYPEYFIGAISHAAQSYLPTARGVGHFPGLTLRDFKRGPRAKLRWVVISGDKDYNYQEILKTSEEWASERHSYRFLDVPGMGHHPSDAPSLQEAIRWIEDGASR